MRSGLFAMAIAFFMLACSPGKDELKIDLIGAGFTQAEEPYLFTDKAGQTWLSYQQRNDTLTRLWITGLQLADWSAPQLIASGKDWFVNWADYPVIASDGEGHMMAHVLVRSGEEKFAYDIRIAVSNNNGKNWTIPRKLHDDTTRTEHGFVSILPYQNNFFVCWLDGRNTGGDEAHEHDSHHGSMTLRAAVVDTQGNKLQEWELDNRVCDCCQTTAAITDSGPVVIYRNRSEEEVRDIFITRYENGMWSEPQPVFNDNWLVHGCPVNGPRCDALGNTLVVAWFTAHGDEPKVNVIFSADGGKTFGKPIRIDEGHTIGRVDVIMVNEKQALVSWMEGDAIKIAFVYVSGERGKSLLVARSSEKRASGFPQLTRTTEGAVIAWTSPADSTVKTAYIRWKRY